MSGVLFWYIPIQGGQGTLRFHQVEVIDLVYLQNQTKKHTMIGLLDDNMNKNLRNRHMTITIFFFIKEIY
jgi:hypothetical protein